jgi:acetyl-CoA C-acetyltransferase
VSADPRLTPVVIGGGQFTNRDENPESAPNPFELMATVAKAASTDAGSGTWLDKLTHCWMVHSISVRHGDPATELAGLIGAPEQADKKCSGMGGNVPQWLVNRAADLVVSGQQPVVLIIGAEALATKKRARRAGVKLDWPSSDGWPDMWPPLEADMGVHPLEDAHGLRQATTMYALIESAIAHSAGQDPAAHARSIGVLMEGLNKVAAQNPNSWFRTPRTAAELMTETPDNRIICTPYPKYLNAVMDVDMAAAILVTDAETARHAGVAPEAVTYLSGWADAYDVWYLSERPAVDRSPALDRCVRSALDASGYAGEDLAGFDLYSCFPSSVEVAKESFGIHPGDRRPVTLTGGLPYHGGPGSNYVTHAVCNAIERVRSGRGPVAVQGNGYYLTKQAVGIYSRDAPRTTPGPGRTDLGAEAAGDPTVEVDAGFSGNARIRAWTIPYGRDGEHEAGIVVLDTKDGTRTIARADTDLTAMLLGADRDLVGEAVVVRPNGATNLASVG